MYLDPDLSRRLIQITSRSASPLDDDHLSAALTLNRDNRGTRLKALPWTLSTKNELGRDSLVVSDVKLSDPGRETDLVRPEP